MKHAALVRDYSGPFGHAACGEGTPAAKVFLQFDWLFRQPYSHPQS